MRQGARWIVIGFVGLLGGSVEAHSTGHEARSAEQCAKLPAPQDKTCQSCVSRPTKHHYHPDLPPGQRCRPDEEKK